jgi:hypothetical protein
MENKQSQNPSKSGSQSSGSSIEKKSSSKVGSDEFDIETKHPSQSDGEVLSGGGSKDSGSCSSGGCGTKQ